MEARLRRRLVRRSIAADGAFAANTLCDVNNRAPGRHCGGPEPFVHDAPSTNIMTSHYTLTASGYGNSGPVHVLKIAQINNKRAGTPDIAMEGRHDEFGSDDSGNWRFE